MLQDRGEGDGPAPWTGTLPSVANYMRNSTLEQEENQNSVGLDM